MGETSSGTRYSRIVHCRVLARSSASGDRVLHWLAPGQIQAGSPYGTLGNELVSLTSNSLRYLRVEQHVGN